MFTATIKHLCYLCQSLLAQQHLCYPCPVPTGSATPILSLPSPYRLSNTCVIPACPVPTGSATPVLSLPVPTGSATPVLSLPSPCPFYHPIFTSIWWPLFSSERVLWSPSVVLVNYNLNSIHFCPVPTGSATPILSLPSPYRLSNTYIILAQSLLAQQHPCYPCPVPAGSATPVLSLPSPYRLSNTHIIPAQSLLAQQHPYYPCPVPTGSATPILSLPSPYPFCHPIFTSIWWPLFSSARGLWTSVVLVNYNLNSIHFCPVPTGSATPILSLPVPTGSATPILSLPSPYRLSNTCVIPAQSLPLLPSHLHQHLVPSVLISEGPMDQCCFS